MGLFDKIKKSLFKNSEEKNEESHENHLNNNETPIQDKTSSNELENDTKEITEKTISDGQSNDVKKSDAEVLQPNEVETTEKISISQEIPVEKDNNIKSQDDINLPENHETDQTRYDHGLEKTNKSFGAKLNAFFSNFRVVDDYFFDDLEDLLIESDVGFETAEELTESLKEEARLKNAKTHDELKKVVIEKLVDLYDKNNENDNSALSYNENEPNVYLFVGVNGAGKTTTIGKLAKRLNDSGKSVMLVAADTFRAGAVEQLVEWGKRAGVPVITGKEKADPASVVYDGVNQAKEKNIDYLLVDTAGRLQNKTNLMNELDKIKRTISKVLPDQPNEILLVLDGSTGQNALLQAKDFDKITKLTGLVLTKLDGSSKGGVVLAIRNEMNIPVKLVGLGEKVDDLADFDSEKFAIGLFQGII